MLEVPSRLRAFILFTLRIQVLHHILEVLKLLLLCIKLLPSSLFIRFTKLYDYASGAALASEAVSRRICELGLVLGLSFLEKSINVILIKSTPAFTDVFGFWWFSCTRAKLLSN